MLAFRFSFVLFLHILEASAAKYELPHFWRYHESLVSWVPVNTTGHVGFFIRLVPFAECRKDPAILHTVIWSYGDPPAGILSYANVWLYAATALCVALNYLFRCPLVSAVFFHLILLFCACPLPRVRMGVSEDSVHKRDAKLFEKLRLKLFKVRRSIAQTKVPR